MAYRYRVPTLCACGSGEFNYELLDAAGIYCGLCCEKCEAKLKDKFDPAIFDGRSAYAGTGEEIDIGRYEGEDY